MKQEGRGWAAGQRREKGCLSFPSSSPLGPLYSPTPYLILDFPFTSLQSCSLAWFTPEPSVEGAATEGVGVRERGLNYLFPRLRDGVGGLGGENKRSQFPRILCNVTQDSLGENKNGQLPTIEAGVGVRDGKG